MDSHVNVLLYSKFSQASKNFVEIMEQVPHFRQNTTLLCIDNKEVRERIKKNDKLQVNQVPCLARIYDTTGYVELFEGEKAFSILDLYYQEMLKEQVKFNPEPMVRTPQNIPMSEIQLEEPSIISERSSLKKEIPKVVSFSTPIEELVDDDTSQNTGNTDNRNSDVAISTYLHINKNEKIDTDNSRNIPDRAIKKIENNSPSGNLVSRAMQMQKERESDLPSSNPNIPKI